MTTRTLPSLFILFCIVVANPVIATEWSSWDEVKNPLPVTNSPPIFEQKQKEEEEEEDIEEEQQVRGFRQGDYVPLGDEERLIEPTEEEIEQYKSIYGDDEEIEEENIIEFVKDKRRAIAFEERKKRKAFDMEQKEEYETSRLFDEKKRVEAEEAEAKRVKLRTEHQAELEEGLASVEEDLEAARAKLAELRTTYDERSQIVTLQLGKVEELKSNVTWYEAEIKKLG